MKRELRCWFKPGAVSGKPETQTKGKAARADTPKRGDRPLSVEDEQELYIVWLLPYLR